MPGPYTCRVTTALDRAEHSQALVVRARTRVLEQPVHITLRQGETGTLSCTFITDPSLLPNLTIHWQRGEERVEGEQEEKEEGVVSRVVVEEEGKYSCVGTTRLDTMTSRAAWVTVDGGSADSSLLPPPSSLPSEGGLCARGVGRVERLLRHMWRGEEEQGAGGGGGSLRGRGGVHRGCGGGGDVPPRVLHPRVPRQGDAPPL